MWSHWQLLLLAGSVSPLKFVQDEDQDPSIQVTVPPYGILQGTILDSLDNGLPFHAFEGIPYAKPPLGDLRFRAPEDPDPWDGVLSADGTNPNCIEIPAVGPYSTESEDCLYLNVYKPIVNTTELLPVMVWIYGGGFLFGRAFKNFYGPDYLITQNVIVVHFNYRLNSFGFLSTGDMSSPGNYGMKDQVLAIKWVNSNIINFGGDPNNTVIFGESAGGASVEYHLLSKLSEGLFQGAISQSGSAICTWAYQEEATKVTKLVAIAAGFRYGVFTDTKDVVAYLRKLTTEQLKRATIIVVAKEIIRGYNHLPFAPVIEPDHPGAFMTENAYQILEEGRFQQVPYMSGFNSQESAIVQEVLDLFNPIVNVVIKFGGSILVPIGLSVNDSMRERVGDEVKDYYFSNNKPISRQLENYISDGYFYRPITEAIRLHSKYVPVYMYRFAYQGTTIGRRAFKVREGAKNLEGAHHAEEMWYIFSRLDLTEADPEGALIRKKMVRLWTNFAKYRNPTPEDDPLLHNVRWKPVQPGDLEPSYMDITTTLDMRKGHKKEAMSFWRHIFKQYGNTVLNTY